MRKYVSIVRDGVVILAITAVLLLMIEVCLRIVFHDEPYMSVTVAPQPKYLHRLIPGAKSTYVRSAADGGDKVAWEVNDQGYRGPPLLKESDHRIVVYGDSNVQAIFSTLDHTLAMRLQVTLSESTGTVVEVVNGGVIGYGPDQISLRLEDEIESLDPDLVVLHVYADNDFGDLIRNKLFRIASDGRLISTDYRVLPSIRRKFIVDRLKTLYVHRARHWIRRDLGMESEEPEAEFHPRIEAMLEQCRAEYRSYADSDVIEYSYFADHYDYDMTLEPDSDSAITKQALMEAVIRRIKGTVASHGSKLVLLILPSKVDLVENFDANHSIFSRHYPQYRASRMSDLLDSIALRNDIPVLNLYPYFSSHGPTDLYFKDDNHWSDKGQAVASGLLAEFILKERLLE